MNKDLLSNIKRMEVYYGGYLLGYRNATVIVKEDVVEIDVMFKNKQIMNKDVFMDRLKQLHIDKWKHTYRFNEVGIIICDGYDWSLDIYYNNGSRKKHYYGNNDAPEGFDALLELVGIDYE